MLKATGKRFRMSIKSVNKILKCIKFHQYIFAIFVINDLLQCDKFFYSRKSDKHDVLISISNISTSLFWDKLMEFSSFIATIIKFYL